MVLSTKNLYLGFSFGKKKYRPYDSEQGSGYSTQFGGSFLIKIFWYLKRKKIVLREKWIYKINKRIRLRRLVKWMSL